MTGVDLAPLSLAVRPRRRFAQLLAGLALYGTSMAMMIRATLGLNPWDVLHQEVALRTGWSFGTVTALTGLVVLLAWIPLLARVALLVGGVVGNGLATAAYVGARLGPGPRDGLMTGLHARTGFSVRAVRTVIESTVLALGWLLGGTVGLGTVLYALAIGPLTQLFLPRVVCASPADTRTATWSHVVLQRPRQLPHDSM